MLVLLSVCFPLLSACVLAVSSITSQTHLLPAEERLLQVLQKWKNWSTCPLRVTRSFEFELKLLETISACLGLNLQLSIMPMPFLSLRMWNQSVENVM